MTGRAVEPVLEALARFVAETPARHVPAEARAAAGLIVADTVGAILGGSAEPEMVRLRAGAERAAGPATVLAAGLPRREPWWAIVANGTAGTMLELDEGNRFARGHPGIHVWPATLAEAERLGSDGADTLTAFILGYDVAARLGGAGPVRPGMHMHGVHGAVGAAAVVARLRGLDRAGVASALAVAAGLTLGTSWRTALDGATVRNAYAGVGGANGWLAVDLAAAGLTGLPDMLSETFGRISGQGLDEAQATALLGTRFEVGRNYFKLHACCRFNHPALDALEAMLAGQPVGAAEVERCRVVTNAPAATMSEQDPVGSLGAKFSIPYALAARLVLGTTGPEAFREPALSDPRIRALARRVEVVADPALTAELPARRPAVVILDLAGGRRLERRVDIPGGEFDHPYSVSDLEAKFAALAAPALGAAGASRAFAFCRSLDRLPGGARELTDGLRALAARADGPAGQALLDHAVRP